MMLLLVSVYMYLLCVIFWVGEMLEHLVPHPDYKLLTIKNIPQMSAAAHEFSTYQWHGLLKHLRQMLISDAPMEEGGLPEQLNILILFSKRKLETNTAGMYV